MFIFRCISEYRATRAEQTALREFEGKLKTKTVKGDWQVFPSYVRGVDFVGYRTFLGYTLLRKSTCKNFKTRMIAIRRKTESGQVMNYSDWCSINSYKGWLKHCDSYRLRQKYIAPIQDDADRYYREVVKTKNYRKAV